jgi:hypothetical protein
MQLVLWFLIGCGIILRVAQYLVNRSLWMDEAMLALSIIRRSFSELLKPLDFNQAAPVAFLMLQRLAVELQGDSELALRLVPLLAGIGSMFLFYGVARRLLEGYATLISLGLFALSYYPIYYASEVKQYSSDLAIALLLLYLSARYAEPRRPSGLWTALFGAAGVIAVWFSHPAAFVLAGLGVTLLAWHWRNRDWAGMVRLSALGALWLCSFGINYWFFSRPLASNQGLIQYWSGSFMPFPPRSLTDVGWFKNHFLAVFDHPGGLSAGLAVFFFVIGSAAMILSSAWRYSLVTAPIAVTLLASGLGLYPFSGRLLLFIVPSLLLVVAAGAEQTRLALRYTHALGGVLLLIALFAGPVLGAASNLAKPRAPEQIRPVLHYLLTQRQSNDVVYVHHGAFPAYQYYAKRLGLDQSKTIFGIKAKQRFWNYVDDVEQLHGLPRVWILFSHGVSLNGIDEQTLILQYLDRIGKRLDSHQAPGAALVLYDLTGV